MRLHQGTLLGMARKKQLSHPTSKAGLDSVQWRNAFESTPGENPIDRSIAEAASWLATHFERVRLTRNHHKLSRHEHLTLKDLLHVHLAAANLGFVEVSAQQREEINPSNTSSLEKIIGYKSDLTQDGTKVDPNQLIMMRLDSICPPIFEAMKNKDRIEEHYKSSADARGLSKLHFVQSELMCSQLHHNGSALWQDVLYGDAFFSVHPNGQCIVVSKQNDLGKMRAICDYRRDHHSATTFIEVNHLVHNPNFKLGPKAPTKAIKYAREMPLKVCGITTFGSLFEKCVKARWVEQFLCLEEHLFGLMEVKSSEQVDGDNYSVRDVLLVWFHLTLIAHQMVDLLIEQRADSTLFRFGDLLNYSAWLSRENLIGALSEVTSFSESKINSILCFITYEANDIQDDLWLKPVLAIEQEVALSLSALLTARLRRNVDMWLPLVDPNANLRGWHFEKHMIRVMEECRKGSGAICSNLSWTGAIEVKYSKSSEEIDLTFSFGNVIVVVELRSRRIPITPLDYHNALHEKKSGIFKKAAQANRKAQYVRDHLSDFCADHYPHLKNCLQNVVVYPLVILNDQFHAGFPCGDVPVLDEHLLKHFLRDGRAKFCAKSASDYRYEIVFYQDSEEAERVFMRYAKSPTIIEAHVATLKETFDIHRIAENEAPIHWHAYDVQEPEDEAQTLAVLRNLSVGTLIDRNPAAVSS